MSTATTTVDPTTLEYVYPTSGSIKDQLVDTAASLLKAIYTPIAGHKEFFPSHYGALQSGASTSYVLHDQEDTSIVIDASTQWQCAAQTNNWGKVTNLGAGTATAATCATDCSGFATGLFALASKQAASTMATAINNLPFSDFRSVAKGVTPGFGVGDSVPFAEDYYDMMTSESGTVFQSITDVSKIKPGDFISFVYNSEYYTEQGKTDTETATGHIMLIMAISKSETSDGDYIVVVADESAASSVNASGGHSDLDTRAVNGIAGGLGCGYAKLKMADATTSAGTSNQIVFGWSYNEDYDSYTDSTSGDTYYKYEVAVGRIDG